MKLADEGKIKTDFYSNGNINEKTLFKIDNLYSDFIHRDCIRNFSNTK